MRTMPSAPSTRTCDPAGKGEEARAAQSSPATFTLPEPRTGSIDSVTWPSLPARVSVRDGTPAPATRFERKIGRSSRRKASDAAAKQTTCTATRGAERRDAHREDGSERNEQEDERRDDHLDDPGDEGDDEPDCDETHFSHLASQPRTSSPDQCFECPKAYQSANPIHPPQREESPSGARRSLALREAQRGGGIRRAAERASARAARRCAAGADPPQATPTVTPTAPLRSSCCPPRPARSDSIRRSWHWRGPS